MFIKILIALAVLVILLVVVISLRPDTFRVERSITIAAPPSVIFPHLNSPRAANAWSPWMKLDPNMKQTFTGPESGVGAATSWDGNNEVGAGSCTITESRPNEFVQVNLEFLRPFKGTNTAEYLLKSEGDSTVMTWSMYGKANFMAKAVGLFMDCEKMCGDQFNTGLQNLKTLVESNKGL